MSWAGSAHGRDSIGSGSGSRPSLRPLRQYRIAWPNAEPLRTGRVEHRTATVHGRAISYLGGGAGPVLLLIHGMAGTCRELAVGDRAAGPAPHGDRARLPRPRRSRRPAAATTRWAASPAACATCCSTLGHERATLVGHSLGGGVAMQFTYQFPEMVERLVLVSSGGLGPDVSPILRAAALPGADLFIAATAGIGQQVGVAGRPRPRHASACGPAPTSPRSPAATPRSPTPSAARPSSRPCARWSAPRASASPPSTASTWPRRCRC